MAGVSVDTDTHREEHHVKTQADTGGKQPQAKDSWHPPWSWQRKRKDSFPEPPGKYSPANTWPWTYSLQDQRIHFCCFKSPSWGTWVLTALGNEYTHLEGHSVQFHPPQLPSPAVAILLEAPASCQIYSHPSLPRISSSLRTDRPTHQPFFHLEEMKHFPPFWTHFLIGHFSPLLSPLRFHSAICPSCLPPFHTTVYGGRSVKSRRGRYLTGSKRAAEEGWPFTALLFCHRGVHRCSLACSPQGT